VQWVWPPRMGVIDRSKFKRHCSGCYAAFLKRCTSDEASGGAYRKLGGSRDNFPLVPPIGEPLHTMCSWRCEPFVHTIASSESTR
jgi:hypothetical protein